jgi:4-alpha-glucanotransferase
VAGVRIVRFAYNEKQKRIVPRYADVNKYPGHVVAYPSTHDTESLVGYLKKLSAAERRLVSQRIGVEYSTDVKELAKRFIQSLLASKSHCVIVPLRDWLGSSARINVPGTEKPIGDRNWRYKTEIPIEEFPDLKGYCR